MSTLTARLGGLATRIRPSRIGVRLLAFNVLLVFLPVSGLLYLDVYETQLLDVQERGMVQQARLVAAAAGANDAVSGPEMAGLLTRLERQGEARIRIYDASGVIVADSVRALDPSAGRPDGRAGEYASSAGVRQRLLYRFGAFIARVRRTVASMLSFLWPSQLVSSDSNPAIDSGPSPELRRALSGRYGAAVRPTVGQRSLTLYSAVPIRSGDRILGAVVVSQSTFRILQALYDVRLRMFEIVVWSIGVALGLALLTSATIVRPLVRLRRAALALTDRRATPADFRVERKDEIGDLARALEDLTTRLDAHIRLLESFAGDIAHEFKNPLASIRAAAEVLASTETPVERERLLGLLIGEVNRLEGLVSGVRELARIDAEIAHETVQGVDLRTLVQSVVDGFRLREPRASLVFEPAIARTIVRGNADRLAQVFENVIENALSFAPTGSIVQIDLGTSGGRHVVTIADRGPGFPPAHLERVFERFFTYRPATAGREHMGLGLAIAQAIVQGYGGSMTAGNRAGGGAVVSVSLPANH